jgi:hypothetical protein
VLLTAHWINRLFNHFLTIRSKTMANYHVSKDKESGQWKATREGAKRASVLTDTQKETERLAKKLSANSGGGEVRIHGRDGKIRDSDTVPPANDPNPPKDKKH